MKDRVFGQADWILVVTLLLSYAYFSQAGGWNQNSRFDLVRAIVEQGTTRIDAYADNTGDKAVLNGHTYSDKAPGQALTALPLATVVDHGQLSPGQLALLGYAATVLASGVPTVVAALALRLSARALGASATGATVAAIGYGLASPAWVYATLLWGHALAAGCLAVGFAAAIAVRKRQPSMAVVVGLASGWAVVTEFPAAPAAAILVGLTAVYGGKRAFALGTIAFAIPMVVLATYNALSFGSPLFVSYSAVQGFAGMSEGLFGVTFPKRTVLQEILFGQFRGLVPLAPAVLLAPIGLLAWWRIRANRPAVAAAALIAIYYLLFNSAYYYWDGGFSYGPRHIGAALPFLFLGLAPLWTMAPRALKTLVLLLIGFGAAITTMAISTTVLLPEDVATPIQSLVVPSFLRGDLAQNRQSFLQYGDALPAQGLLGAWNFGQLLGLPGLLSLLPLAALWLVAGYLLMYRFRER